MGAKNALGKLKILYTVATPWAVILVDILEFGR